MKPRQWLGVGILAGVVVAVVVYLLWPSDPEPDPVTGVIAGPAIVVSGYAGNLKIPFLEDPEVAAILSERYGLTVEAEGRATIEMLCQEDLTDVDFLWAGDQSQIGVYEECNNRQDAFRNIFNSPLVIYSWTDTTDALIDVGVVRVDEAGVYRLDMVGLLALIESGKSWNEFGFENRPSKIMVQTTDPNYSNSGKLFSALLANTMNCMDVANASTVDAILPGVYDYFSRIGFMERSSPEMFRLYLSIGEGAYPLVALYESQIVEHLIANPEDVQLVADDIRMLYPVPTVWTTHPLIALTADGERFMQALLDEDIQQMGWEKNGFRPSVPGVQIDREVAKISGIQDRITSVIDVPTDPIMAQVLDAINNLPEGGAPARRECEPAEPDVPASPVAMKGGKERRSGDPLWSPSIRRS